MTWLLQHLFTFANSFIEYNTNVSKELSIKSLMYSLLENCQNMHLIFRQLFVYRKSYEKQMWRVETQFYRFHLYVFIYEVNFQLNISYTRCAKSHGTYEMVP